MSIDSLGEVRDSFRPRIANIGAGMILGLALLAGGISAASFLVLREDPRPLRDMGDHIAKYVMIAALGLVAPAGGIVLLVWMKRLLGHSVTVFENGFAYVYRSKTELIPWVEVEKITEVVTHESLKVLKVPGAAIKNVDRSYVVRRKDGKEFQFTVNSVDGIHRLVPLLRAAQEGNNIPWEYVEQ